MANIREKLERTFLRPAKSESSSEYINIVNVNRNDISTLDEIYNAVRCSYDLFRQLKQGEENARKDFSNGVFIHPSNMKDFEPMTDRKQGVGFAYFFDGKIAGYTGAVTDPSALIGVYNELFNYDPSTTYTRDTLPKTTPAGGRIEWMNSDIAEYVLKNAQQIAASIEIAVLSNYRRKGIAKALKRAIYSAIKHTYVIVRLAEIIAIDDVSLHTVNEASKKFMNLQGGEEFAIVHEDVQVSSNGTLLPSLVVTVAWHCYRVHRQTAIKNLEGKQRS